MTSLEKKQDQIVVTHSRIKSILKARKKPSTAEGLRAKTSTTSSVGSSSLPRGRKNDANRKKVEITTPSHSTSSTSIKEHRSRSSFRKTPLPRVALLPPRPTNLEKLLPKQKTFSLHRESTLATSPQARGRQTPPKVSASTSKIKAKPVSSTSSHVGGAQRSTSPKRSKSRKKLKKRKSKSTSDVREDGGKQYIKELVTINELLKSVTDPANKVPGVPLIEGFVRPFSAMELNQLLTSVGKVATIHKDPTNLVPKTAEQKEEDARKAKLPVGELTEEEELAVAISETPSKKKKKKRKSKNSVKSKSLTLTAAKNSKAKEKTEPKPIPAKGSASKNLASKKTLKSNVNTVKVKTKITGGRKELNKKQSKDDLDSELSELDLVKSALLNKRYYEESLKMQVAAQNPKSAALKNAMQIKKNREFQRSKAAHYSAHAFVRSPSPTGRHNAAANKGRHASLQNPRMVKTAVPSGRSTGKLPLPPLKPKKTDEAYNKALDNVLINYSHAIRPPTRRGLERVSSKPKIEHRGVARLEKELEAIKPNAAPFEEQLQNIKYAGPVERGMLDIDHVKVPEEPTSGKYTKLSASKFTSTITGSGPAEVEVVPPSILVKDRRQDTASSEGTPKSKGSRRRSRKSNSGSRSRSPKQEIKPPVTAPVVGFRFGSAGEKEKEKKGKNSTRANTAKNRTSPLTRTIKEAPNQDNEHARNNKFNLQPPIVNLVKPRSTTRWNDQSIAPSLFTGLPESGSRWAVLNQRILEKNQELKAEHAKNKKIIENRPKGAGHGRGAAREGVGQDRSSKQGDPMEEKRIFLKNLDRAKKAFDEFGIHDNVMAKKYGRDKNAKIDEAFGPMDTLAGKTRT